MSNLQLIKALVKELQPVRRHRSPLVFAMWSSVLLMLFVGVVVLLVTPRSDLGSKALQTFFLSQLLLTVALAGLGMGLLAWLTSPGRPINTWLFVANGSFFLILLGLNIFHLLAFKGETFSHAVDSADCRCFAITLILAGLPAAILGKISRTRVVTKPWLVGMVIGLTAISIGSLAVNLHCSSDDVVHVSVFHFLAPCLLGSVSGYFIGRKFLRW